MSDRNSRLVDPEDAEPQLAGGKAANLRSLQRFGMPVPGWFCVTTLVCRDLAAGVTDPEQRAQAIRSKGLPAADREALLAKFDTTFAPGSFVAVRSSAIGEDSASDSYAGQMDSFLFVTRETLIERVLDCFASAFSKRAICYRKLRGRDANAVEMAVIVQQMVDSRVSGILFTANPATGDPTEAVLVAGFGLGEGVVSERVETDTWFVSLATGRILERVVNEKRSQVVFDHARREGTTIVGVEEGTHAALTDAQIEQVVSVGRRLGTGQDIEWAIDATGKLYVLQVRPITTLNRREGIFDNSNIVESYPGLSLPLTFSFARSAYEETFRQAGREFGVPERVLRANRHVHANLVTLIDGRFYYNILNWYKLYLLVPGFEWALPAWERALGLEHSVRPASTPPNRLVQLGVLWRMGMQFVHLQRNVRRFRRLFEELHAEYRAADLGTMDIRALVELYRRLEGRLLRAFAISVVNDVFAQQLYHLLGRLAARWGLGNVQNELLCGEAGMESVLPVRSLLALADRIRSDDRLRGLFESESSEEHVWNALHQESRFADLRKELRSHLERYGDRTLHELKLETPPAEDNPRFLITMLRNYLRTRPIEGRESNLRRHAERRVANRLGKHPLRQAAFRWVLRHCRRAVRNREDLRLYRSRAFGMVKRIFRAMGRIFQRQGQIERADDIFYLTVEEACGGEDRRTLVDLRKQEYARYPTRNPPARIVTPSFARANITRVEAPPSGDELRGLGCSSGQARAPAKVIVNPDADLRIQGEILVAPMTDPGWVFLMVSAGGIVSERGSLLSHTAIIGRELGIPTVVGVKQATQRIHDGQMIEIDGQTGVVRLRP